MTVTDEAGTRDAGAGSRGDGHWASRRMRRSGTSSDATWSGAVGPDGSAAGPTAWSQPPAAWIAACMSDKACCTGLSPLMAA